MLKQVLSIVILCSLILSINGIKPTFASEPIEDSWVSIASMPTARSALGTVALNYKIYAIGGSLSTREPLVDLVATNEEYNISANTWVTRGPMPTPRAYFAIAAYQNKVYCIGGAVGMASVDERSGFTGYVTTNINEAYDVVTGTWTTMAPMPKEGMYISAQEVNGKIYVIGQARLYVYDPAADSWTNKTSMPLPLPGYPLVSAAFDDKIVFTGKYGVENALQRPHDELQTLIYDTVNDSWAQASSAPTVVTLGGAAATTGTAAPKRVYVFGLATEFYPPFSVNEIYDPQSDTWTTGMPTPENRSDFSVAVANDQFYAIGGYLYAPRTLTLTNLNERYTPMGYDSTVHTETPLVSPSDYPEQQIGNNQQLSSVIIIAAVAVTVIAIISGFAVYLKRRKRIQKALK